MKKKLNINKKTKKIITAVATMILSMLLLVSVTYAWFTLTNKPKIEGFMLKVGTTGKLEIATENTDSKYGTSIEFDDIENMCLKPLTTLNGQEFYKPSARDPEGVVTNVSKISESDLLEITNKNTAEGGYIIKKTFYLKATTESKNQEVGIKLLAGSKNGDVISGTYINNKNDNNGKKGSASVRVGITCGSTTKVLEPCSDVSVGTASQFKLDGWNNLETIKHTSTGKFEPNGKTTQDKTDDLFKIKANEGTLVTMYIWLEGADKDCVNEIQGSEIEYSFQFTSDDIE